MQLFRALGEVPGDWGRSVIAIGNFDGVHRGHRAILDDVCRRAGELHARAVVVTFDPHPLRVLRPAEAPPLITPIEQRLALLAETGVDATLLLPFTEAFSYQSAEVFAQTVLHDALHAIAVHEGDNFRFGYRAEADVETLRTLGERMGFSVAAHSLLHRRGYPVASSQIRSFIAQGRVEQARGLLGRTFSIASTPARGRGIGARLLVPTVNLAPYGELKPAHGVYITRLRVAGRTFEAITNAGNRPTFGEDSYAIESHLLNYDPAANPVDLNEQTPLDLCFLRRLRGEQRFPSPEALMGQIRLDVAEARRYHALAARLATAAH